MFSAILFPLGITLPFWSYIDSPAFNLKYSYTNPQYISKTSLKYSKNILKTFIQPLSSEHKNGFSFFPSTRTVSLSFLTASPSLNGTCAVRTEPRPSAHSASTCARKKESPFLCPERWRDPFLCPERKRNGSFTFVQHQGAKSKKRKTKTRTQIFVKPSFLASPGSGTISSR